MRAHESDLVHLEELHTRRGLDFDILVERFRTEMTHVLGNRDHLRHNFLELISRLFRELDRAKAERLLAAP